MERGERGRDKEAERETVQRGRDRGRERERSLQLERMMTCRKNLEARISLVCSARSDL